MTNEERDQALEQRVIWNLIAKVTLTLFSTIVLYSRRAKTEINSVSWKKNMLPLKLASSPTSLLTNPGETSISPKR
jgi:hypothetical protein